MVYVDIGSISSLTGDLTSTILTLINHKILLNALSVRFLILLPCYDLEEM